MHPDLSHHLAEGKSEEEQIAAQHRATMNLMKKLKPEDLKGRPDDHHHNSSEHHHDFPGSVAHLESNTHPARDKPLTELNEDSVIENQVYAYDEL